MKSQRQGNNSIHPQASSLIKSYHKVKSTLLKIKKTVKKCTHAFPFIISDAIFVHHITTGVREYYENRTLTPLKASQGKKKRKNIGKNITIFRNCTSQDHS